ncbi:DUF4412 domain-containing protein [Emticicia sp. BO119]|uniref:DUF4412 domain-containing protein n=1 Tax=Emticicia sp. BO119 TaxID=2757768 RepID=UPI0015F02444|nr:DUF4412 domain-containing protein [Emticicia sp. BO119]MBA4849099.1 DUF4412 domain-containing protein [Emticicia sp. BO119]
MKTILYTVLVALMNLSVHAQSAQDIAKAMSRGNKIKPKPEYNFAGSLKFQVTANHEGKPYKGEQTWFFPVGNENIFGVSMNMGQRSNMRGVIDYTEKSMIMFMEDQKMIMGIPFDLNKTMNDSKLKVSVPKRTGRTKIVLGYKCDEWVTENADYNTSVWMTDKLPINSTNFYKIMAQQLGKSTGTPMPADMKGVPLEIQGTKKKTGEKFGMVCTEVSTKPIRFSTAGYKTM